MSEAHAEKEEKTTETAAPPAQPDTANEAAEQDESKTVAPLSYTVSQGPNVYEAATRAEAVALAKRLSKENRQKVSVARSDGVVRMQFRDGLLETYVYHTRRD